MRRQSGVGCTPNRRNRTLSPFSRFCASQLAIAGLLAIAIPKAPAVAFTEFQICAAQLVRWAGIAPEAASGACAKALHPEDLSRCVVTISLVTSTLKQDALSACTKVRRPVDLSQCVSDISERTRTSEVPTVIDYCRRSLLPIRFSECVTGLSREVDSAIPRLLDTCITAEDFPRNLSPAFAPSPPPMPTQPLVVPNVEPIRPNQINQVNQTGTNTTITPSIPVTPVVPVAPVNP